MDDGRSLSTDSDIDDLDSCIWPLKNRKKLKKTKFDKPSDEMFDQSFKTVSLLDKYEKFEELKRKSSDMKKLSTKKLYNLEKKRAKKLVKKALRDPFVKELVEENKSSQISSEQSRKKEEEEEWKEVKPFLNINSHIHGPVSHGDWRPKTELESTIEDAIKEGDLEKAELLSDTLANSEFAEKITKAYAAKRYFEKKEEEKTIEKAKNSKKIRWTFEAKERWQMKGNM